MLIIFFVFNILFAFFFVYVGIWYFAILPIIFSIFMLITLSGGEQGVIFDKKKVLDTIMTNLSVIAWALILGGTWGIFKGFALVGISSFDVAFNMFFLNIFLRMFSYFWRYKDGTKIFHSGYYISIFILLLELFLQGLNINNVVIVFLALLVFTFAIYAFINYIISLYRRIFNDYMSYIVFLFFNITMLVFVYAISDGLYSSVIYCQFYLTFLYFFIYMIKRYDDYILTQPEEKKITLEDILKRKPKEKPVYKSYNFNYILGLNNFFAHMPWRIKLFLSSSNILLMVIQILLFVVHIYNSTGTQVIYYEILYWVGIALFFINFLTLKVIDYYYYIQRIVVFFVLNFGIYLSIVNLFGGNYMYIVLIGVAWNIFNNIIIFSTQKLKEDNILMREDYYLWILSNFMALMVNIYFIFRLLPNVLLALSVIVLYIGIQLFLSFYNVKFIEE